MSDVIDYCTEEVQRQGHMISSIDGIERVGWMLDAWCYAIAASSARRLPTVGNVVQIGKMIERNKNFIGFRRVDVWVGSRICPKPSEITFLMNNIFGELDESTPPLDFYRSLLEVHPFVDGNGRTGKVVLNWLNGTLLDPIFPPSDFWGRVIRNP